MELVQRAKNILLTPAAEWQVIERESTNAATLYRGYVMPLAAIGPAASFVAMSMIGVAIPFTGATYRVPVGSAVMHTLLSYGLTLAGVYLLALLINAIAPRFGGAQSVDQALKVSVYSSTAAWLAGVFALMPSLAVLGLGGLYSLYLMYTGLPVLMKAPQEKAIGYTAVVVVCAVVMFMVIGAISGALIGTQSPVMQMPQFSPR